MPWPQLWNLRSIPEYFDRFRPGAIAFPRAFGWLEQYEGHTAVFHHRSSTTLGKIQARYRWGHSKRLGHLIFIEDRSIEKHGVLNWMGARAERLICRKFEQAQIGQSARAKPRV